VDGLAFVRALSKLDSMPMAKHFAFEIVDADVGSVTAAATPGAGHENPFRVVQGGFAATVLDIVLGLVAISVLPSDSESVATTDLSVRYIRAIRADTGRMTIRGSTIHVGGRTVVAQASLYDSADRLYAVAQSTSLIRASTTS